ncbi:MAG: flagellar export chaperone FliS [Bordetella sp. SCN 67-23]|nr:flagellar export chaperone FliS [Burkholderiales bacterium]ODS73371.1 MAG: flagellar export chaperone FliS [Bordetella sp. SCN 67-23]ODU76301.1 MAG: flagellar export chaperone FliS [Bordetella sp. SCN 68-11]OJW88341.1 MAG: flagellar export chaperone FliS [Burkholderiales bacterium 67-32]
MPLRVQQESHVSGFGNFGARAYVSVGVETGVSSSSPHALILMLYDGALESLRKAIGCIEANDPLGKTRALSRATRILDEGLRASLDHKAGGDLANQLNALYDYMLRRTMQAGIDNDPAPIMESVRLLDGLREAWASIQADSQVAA